MSIQQIRTTAIQLDPSAPRHHISRSALDGLSDDIRRRGFIHPLIVRRDGSRYFLLQGQRRWQAAIALDLPNVPCLVLDSQLAADAPIAENLGRESVRPYERAFAFTRLLAQAQSHNSITRPTSLPSRSNYSSARAVARQAGLSRARVSHFQSLAALPDPIKEMLSSGAISTSHASELSRLRGLPDHQLQLAHQCCAGSPDRLSRSRLRTQVSAILNADAGEQPAESLTHPAARLPARAAAQQAPPDPLLRTAIALREALQSIPSVPAHIRPLLLDIHRQLPPITPTSPGSDNPGIKSPRRR